MNERDTSSDPQAPTGESAGALVEQLQRQSRERREEILAKAREELAHRLREARHHLRRRVHEAVAAEREQMNARLREARSRIMMKRRRLELQKNQETLRALHPRLARALETCWADPMLRERWVQGLFSLAQGRLLGRSWVVDHPPGWEPEAPGELDGNLELAWNPDDALRAGLRIHCGSASIDGSIQGLLAQGDGVDGLLLGELVERERNDG